jgi:glycosyltransferase involved in cell wall biosynthesis
MSLNSGFANIIDGFKTLGVRIKVIEAVWSLKYRIFFTLFKLFKTIRNDRISPFNREIDNLIALLIKIHLKFNKNDSVIIIYGENTYNSAIAKFPEVYREKINVILHQPISWYKIYHSNVLALNNVSNLFCLATNQIDCFRNLGVTVPIHVIQHGLSNKFLNYKVELERNINKILFVGSWLRDIQLIIKLCKLILLNTEFQITFILPMNNRSNHLLELTKYAQFNLLSNLNDDDLLREYSTSFLLVHPLIDSTANNSILEAITTKTPILTNRTDGTVEYSKFYSSGFFMLNEPDETVFFDKILELSKTGEINVVTQNMDLLRWENIAKEVLNIIKNE